MTYATLSIKSSVPPTSNRSDLSWHSSGDRGCWGHWYQHRSPHTLAYHFRNRHFRNSPRNSPFQDSPSQDIHSQDIQE